MHMPMCMPCACPQAHATILGNTFTGGMTLSTVNMHIYCQFPCPCIQGIMRISFDLNLF